MQQKRPLVLNGQEQTAWGYVINNFILRVESATIKAPLYVVIGITDFEEECPLPTQKAGLGTNDVSIRNPEVLYHFTSPVGLAVILHTKHIALTESNLNIREGNCTVVWLTSSQSPENNGLEYDNNTHTEYDKMSLRITLPYKDTYQHWVEWSDSKGMDKEYKDTLIRTANAEETHKAWYISESEISLGDILAIDNLATGVKYTVEEAKTAFPPSLIPRGRLANPIDEYIANQPANIQILLLEVCLQIRQALPGTDEKISWQMPTFWRGGNLIHFAAHKNHLGIYPGAEAMEYFSPRLTGYKTSKGAIQFPYTSFGAEQLKLIAEIAAWCGEHNTGK